MNAVVTPALKSANMVVQVAGRIEAASKYQDTVSTLIKTPAPDSYSHPATIEVRSKARLGSVGEEVVASCRLSGVPRRFNRTDKSTGEITAVRTADMYLHVIE